MVVLRLRLALVGEPTSGKTALAQMLQSNGTAFPKNYLMTTGCDLFVKEVEVDEEHVVEVTLLDVAGQKLYDRQASAYLAHASAFLLVYDVSNKATFETCKRWVTRARAAHKAMPGFLVANKTDLADKSEVTDRQAEVFARANQLRYFKCSALRGSGVNEPVLEMARMFVAQYQSRIQEMMQATTTTPATANASTSAIAA